MQLAVKHLRPSYAVTLRLEPEFSPPLRPALEAKWRSRENDRLSDGTLFPPLLAISRCFSGLMDANPRFEVLWLAAIAVSSVNFYSSQHSLGFERSRRIQ